MVAHHPSRRYKKTNQFVFHITLPNMQFHNFTLDTSCRCRKGSAEVLVSFDDVYPLDLWSANTHEDQDGKGAWGSIQICGKDVPRGYWVGIWKGCYLMG